MKIGIIQASSQKEKNEILFDNTKKYASGHEVINFGCRNSDKDSYSYIEIALAIGLLIGSGAVDFIITGCSSGQGMMLACNSMPGVICGYAPTPKDAYLFAQINNGNAVSLPLGEGYTWNGIENFRQTIEILFSEPFGQGYPKEEAERKLKDTLLLKEIRNYSQIETIALLEKLDKRFINHVLSKKNVTDYVLANGINKPVVDWVNRELRIRFTKDSRKREEIEAESGYPCLQGGKEKCII